VSVSARAVAAAPARLEAVRFGPDRFELELCDGLGARRVVDVLRRRPALRWWLPAWAPLIRVRVRNGRLRFGLHLAGVLFALEGLLHVLRRTAVSRPQPITRPG